MYHTTDTVLVIGVGNDYRSDDAAGLEASRIIAKHGLKNVKVVESDGDGTRLIDLWSSANNVIIIDAVAAGLHPKPGTIHIIDAKKQRKLLESLRFSTHTFGILQALKLAANLNNLPENIIIYGIEGTEFSNGLGLRPEVESSVIDIVSMVQNKVFNLQNVKEKLTNG
jgi:hydrogenase maturation protease